MEGFNSQQGASNRDVEVNKEEVVAAEAVTVEDVVDTYRLYMSQEACPGTSPRWEDPKKVIIAPEFAGRQTTSRARRQNPAYSNCYNILNNWNVCYSHGFDVEDGYNSATCGQRKMDRQEGFTCNNAKAYIGAGYAPNMKGMHRNILPTNF
jgi:hypothetical protein